MPPPRIVAGSPRTWHRTAPLRPRRNLPAQGCDYRWPKYDVVTHVGVPRPTARRERLPASDRRAGTYPRARARVAHRAYLRERWRFVVTAAAGFFASTALAAAFLPDGLARGIVIGTGIAGTIGVLAQWIVMVTGTGPLMMGELAEQRTAAELRPLHKAGWKLVNHFALTNREDMDHVLVGPAGLLVVETKWSASPWADDWHADRIRDAAILVARRAELLSRWHPIRRLNLPPAKGVLVLWGAGTNALEARTIADAAVMPGSQLHSWLEQERPAFLQPSDIDLVCAALVEQVERREVAGNVDVVPDSFQTIGLRLVAGVLAGLASFAVGTAAVRVTHIVWIWLACAVASALVVGPLRRFAPVRAAVTGWQTGAVLVAVISALTLALSGLH